MCFGDQPIPGGLTKIKVRQIIVSAISQRNIYPCITIVFGTLLAVLYDREFFGKNVATLLVIAPFFVMPTVSALIWKNFIMHPVYGLIAFVMQKIGLHGIDWFGDHPLISVIIITSWEWLPFAFLILFTSLKSLDQEQKEAASIDGANSLQLFSLSSFHTWNGRLGWS
jgi:sorbitol/mannitol transport system permease protein